jgi:FdrA protein
VIHTIRLYREMYVDSVVQLSGTRALFGVEGVEWASAAMATPGNVATLEKEGFAVEELADAGANDLFIAVRAASADVADTAREAGEKALFALGRREEAGQAGRRRVRTLQEAVDRQPGSTVAVVSVPGDYAALEAHKALSAGLHVLLFSDNVSVDDEIALKDRAAGLGRLVMGPGAGTAMLGGTCLGFANAVAAGRVAVVAAAGTGAQEAATLLDRWGIGVAQVIGLGGRDLSARVGGRMALTAVRGLAADPGVDAILLVSKPPDVSVAREVVAAAGGTPLFAALVGLPEDFPAPAGVTVARTLEAGAVAAVRAMGGAEPDVCGGLAAEVRARITGLPDERRLVRGLFSGGTLCYESLVVLADVLGDVYSNTPLQSDLAVPAPPQAHTCLDLGEEEYTQGRPHPMIDPAARIDLLREQAADPEVAAIVLDVVLGYGAHADPAAELAPVCARIAANGGPCVVVYVLGTDRDPQGRQQQRRAFTDAGCLVTATAARASLAAAAIARRDPAIAEKTL